MAFEFYVFGPQSSNTLNPKRYKHSTLESLEQSCEVEQGLGFRVSGSGPDFGVRRIFVESWPWLQTQQVHAEDMSSTAHRNCIGDCEGTEQQRNRG